MDCCGESVTPRIVHNCQAFEDSTSLQGGYGDVLGTTNAATAPASNGKIFGERFVERIDIIQNVKGSRGHNSVFLNPIKASEDRGGSV